MLTAIVKLLNSAAVTQPIPPVEAVDVLAALVLIVIGLTTGVAP